MFGLGSESFPSRFLELIINMALSEKTLKIFWGSSFNVLYIIKAFCFLQRSDSLLSNLISGFVSFLLSLQCYWSGTLLITALLFSSCWTRVSPLWILTTSVNTWAMRVTSKSHLTAYSPRMAWDRTTDEIHAHARDESETFPSSLARVFCLL